MAEDQKPGGSSSLAESAYDSPYSRSGAPAPHPNGDPYAPLRAKALSILEAMGYDPETMIERGVLWADDQDPFGHVKQSKFMHFLGLGFHRTMESCHGFLTDQEYDDMTHGKTVIPAIRRVELDIRRQVKYPDSLIIANRQERMEPTRYYTTTSVFSLKQQTIVAEVQGYITFIDAKTGRATDIRTTQHGGWPKVYEGFLKKVERAQILKEKWEKEESIAKLKKLSKL
ncbi:hypothetical protein ONZ43_g4082 [Nemania bipapillata]|uniref:Uncharacterized protein n=1 Tax=Nemania bipapillata TaxID=110536 RepID=A0ACC2IS33_9PEZI|nr:hypothetical protein ONZ43_g4082 [Nemania bipapillata]